MDLTGYGLTLFWALALGAAAAAILWTQTHKRRASQAPRLYLEALKAIVDGDDHTAFERLKAVVTEDSNHIDAYLKLGDLLRKRGRFDRAIRVHEELTLRLGLPRNDAVEVQKSLAQDYLAAGKLQEAESALRRILELQKDNQWAIEKMIRMLEDDGRFDEAYEIRRDALKRTGQSDGHLLAMYKALEGLKIGDNGKGHEARLCFKEALNHDAKCLPALLYLGDSYWKEGRHQDAVEWWTQFAESEPRAANAVFERLRKAYFEMGQFGEITKVYESTLDADPKNTGALLGLAELALKKGEFDNALTQFRHVLDIDSDNVAARAGIVRVLVEQKRLRDASDEIDALLETTPFHRGGYSCKRCGHLTDEPAWVCPKCKGVETFQLY